METSAFTLNTQPQSYAAAQNAKYSNTKSNFVDMKDRINSIINSLPLLKQTGVRSAIMDACQKWINRFPNAKTLRDLDLVIKTTITVYGNETGGSQTVPLTVTYVQ